MKKVKLTLSGRVQGVGMRFFINRTATRFKLKGYVKNLYNDKVESVVHGEEAIIEEFIKYIKLHSPGTIDNIVVSDMDNNKIYTKFSVKIF